MTLRPSLALRCRRDTAVWPFRFHPFQPTAGCESSLLVYEAARSEMILLMVSRGSFHQQTKNHPQHYQPSSHIIEQPTNQRSKH